MKKSNYTEEQIAFALKQAALAAPIPDVFTQGIGIRQICTAPS